jgi:hypothetical protein
MDVGAEGGGDVAGTRHVAPGERRETQKEKDPPKDLHAKSLVSIIIKVQMKSSRANFRFQFLFGLLILLGLAGRAFASEDRSDFEDRLVRDNKAVTQFFESTAQGLDLFLVGKESSELPNKTHVLIENSTYLVNDQKTQNQTNLNVHLNLPNFEEYWQLKFTSYDEEEEKRNIEQGYIGQAPKERNYGTTIGFFRKLGEIKASFQPRIQFQNPLQVSYTLTFESVAQLKYFRLNPEMELFANPDQGVGNYFALNANFTLSRLWTLTLINNAEYAEKQALFRVTHGFSFGEDISKAINMSYNWLFFMNNTGNYHLQGYSLSVAFNQELYRRILTYQVIPHWDFDTSTGYVGNPGLTFNLILQF